MFSRIIKKTSSSIDRRYLITTTIYFQIKMQHQFLFYVHVYHFTRQNCATSRCVNYGKSSGERKSRKFISVRWNLSSRNDVLYKPVGWDRWVDRQIGSTRGKINVAVHMPHVHRRIGASFSSMSLHCTYIYARRYASSSLGFFLQGACVGARSARKSKTRNTTTGEEPG